MSKKMLITVTVSRELEIDSEIYGLEMSDEDILKEEIKYAEDLFHEWIEAEGVIWTAEGKIVEE